MSGPSGWRPRRGCEGVWGGIGVGIVDRGDVAALARVEELRAEARAVIVRRTVAEELTGASGTGRSMGDSTGQRNHLSCAVGLRSNVSPRPAGARPWPHRGVAQPKEGGAISLANPALGRGSPSVAR